MDRKTIFQTNTGARNAGNTEKGKAKRLYYGQVRSVEDKQDGGRIRVEVKPHDSGIDVSNLEYASPILPKHFHHIPQVDEGVYILIPDENKPQSNRLYFGSVVSQLPFLSKDEKIHGGSTTDWKEREPDAPPSSFPDAEGIYPSVKDIGLLGRNNNDIIFYADESGVEIRAGKHEVNDPYKLNKTNPASIKLTFEADSGGTNYYSSTVTTSDKIALIAHQGVPEFRKALLTPEDRERIFKEGHPIARGDVLVKALEIIRDAITEHIHNGAVNPATDYGKVTELNSIDFNAILQENIVVN